MPGRRCAAKKRIGQPQEWLSYGSALSERVTEARRTPDKRLALCMRLKAPFAQSRQVSAWPTLDSMHYSRLMRSGN